MKQKKKKKLIDYYAELLRVRQIYRLIKLIRDESNVRYIRGVLTVIFTARSK